MQCPICHGEMETYREDQTYSKNKDIFYTRTRYVCRKDDVWGRLEIPQSQEHASEAAKETAPAPVS
ncbi:MAG TPA: hypothetical protein VFV38_20435 [Ktedonobacteraceae bacterium]|nr:hypothetical protein [Ktedonobacteraceae bacterium]